MAWISRLSIRTKAPLAAAALILIVGVAISTAAFLVIRRTLHDRAAVRLTSLASEYREVFGRNMATSRARSAAVAHQPALAAYLRHPSSELEPAALSALQPRGPQSELIVRAELRDATGRVLLTVTPPGAPDAVRPVVDAPGAESLVDTIPSQPAAPESGAVGFGRFRNAGEFIVYPTVVRIGGAPAGFYVNWRRLANTSQTRTQLANVMGSGGAFYLLNADGSVWSDLGRPVEPPAGTVTLGSAVETERPERGGVLIAAGAIEGTPWAYGFEFPTRLVQAPARTFLRTVALIAAICIAVGGVVAWAMSRRLTQPLHALTVAADALAAGDTTRQVSIPRADELGRLAASFNSMAEQVRGSQARLEGLVVARTRELRAAEESLERREKLALIGQLASGVGHEIRNPLGVMANAIFYLQTIQKDAPAEVQEYLLILHRQVTLSSKIVNDLLDLSRVKSAKRERFDVHTLVGNRLQRFAQNGTQLEADIPANLPPVEADPVHAGQIMDNLLTNAVQAIQGSEGSTGTVAVRARQTGDGFVRIEVSDTGPGVPAEHLVKIFEPLFTTKARGIGLGLALSKTLVQANGGDLSFVSQPGRGATFAFTLPVAGTSI